jgi:hypothetical protein
VRTRALFALVLLLTAALPAGVGVSPNPLSSEPANDLPRIVRSTPPTCTGGARLMQWPAAKPVWEFCFVSPVNSSAINGSGLEIYNASYNGHLVFKRAHAPILNVLYDPGGCGPCYRDWMDQERAYQADNILIPPVSGSNGYAEPTVPPVTACDNNNVDTFGFSGVAAEKLSDRLVLTAQTQAGWYRYMMKWTFFLDGRIHPEFGFGAVSHFCTGYGHKHHNYWRFDFDIDGALNDRLYEISTAYPSGNLMETEALRMNAAGTSWRIADSVTGRGYRLVPGPETALPADSFAVGDFWALRYKPGAEIDDVGQSGPACAIKFNNFLNGETLSAPMERTRTDIVLWYRGGSYHEPNHLDDCHRVGPMLEPIGNWAPGAPAAAQTKTSR